MQPKQITFVMAFLLVASGAMAQTASPGTSSPPPAATGTTAGGVPGSNSGPGPVGNGANPPSSLSPVTGQPTTTDPHPPRPGQLRQ